MTRNQVKPTKAKVVVLQNEIQQYYDNRGYLSWSAKKKMYIILGTNSPQNGLVQCPECKIGKLMLIRSNKTKKRFPAKKSLFFPKSLIPNLLTFLNH